MRTATVARGGIRRVATLAALRALYPTGNDAAYVRAEDDVFLWDALSTATSDGIDTVLRNGQAEETPGRWVREVKPPPEVQAEEVKLTFGQINNGAFLQRVGAQIVGGSPSGQAVIQPRDYSYETLGNTTQITLPQAVSPGWEAGLRVQYGAVPLIRVSAAPLPGQFRVQGATVTLGETIPAGRLLVFNWLEPLS